MTAPRFVSAILAAGGIGARVGGDRPKQFLDLAGQSILERSLATLATHPRVREVIVALPAEHLNPAPQCLGAAWPNAVRAVPGGARRQDSVARAFEAVAAEADIVLVHDAARPFVSATLIDRMIDAVEESGAAIPATPVTDTVKQARLGEGRVWVAGTLPRHELYLAQTPQAFTRDVLSRALSTSDLSTESTDEAWLVERAGGRVQLVEGEATNMKITTAEDVRVAVQYAAARGAPPRIGTGYDLHRLVTGRPLILAGVPVPFEFGLDGHSDADIVCHAVTDAILGAAAVGDIGRLFPDTDPAWKGANSIELLRRATARVHEAGFAVNNVDVTVVAQRPKLLPYVEAMRRNLAVALDIDLTGVSVKGKTNEGVDSIGRGESMACHAVASLVRSAHALESQVPSPEPRQ